MSLFVRSTYATIATVVLVGCGGSGDSGPENTTINANPTTEEQTIASPIDPSNSSDQTDSTDAVFAIADTFWKSECILEMDTPGASNDITWGFTEDRSEFATNLYFNESCSGNPIDVTISGRYEVTGNVTTAVNGLTVHEVNQFIVPTLQQVEVIFQTRWLHLNGDTLSVAIETASGVQFETGIPPLTRQ